MKAFVVKPYGELWEEFIKNLFTSSQRQSKVVPQEQLTFNVTETPELAWIDTIGPTYSKEKANEFLKNRYELPLVPIRYTLKKLLKSNDFKTIVEHLRTEGWLDWQILCCIANIAVNYRLTNNYEVQTNPILMMTLFQVLMQDPEISTTATVPLSEFTEAKIRFQFNILLISSLNTYELECRQRVPDFSAIALFFRIRYRYFTDDIPHEDPFIFFLP